MAAVRDAYVELVSGIGLYRPLRIGLEPAIEKERSCDDPLAKKAEGIPWQDDLRWLKYRRFVR